MKKTIYNIFSLVFMASALFTAISCEEENPIDNPSNSNFPSLVENHDVVPGDTLTFSIQPNSAWSISIPKESYEWFKIIDGKFRTQTLTGVSASEPIEIKVWTTSEESFALRSCVITMKVGSESKEVAKYTLRAKAKTIEVYKAAVTEEGTFSTTDEEYVYEQTPISVEDEIELVWDNNDRRYYFPIKVNANYDWTVEWPSWARADINVDSKVGETSFQIYGIASELPLKDTVGEVVFKDGDNLVKTFKVKIPGCKNIFSYSLGSFTALNFDHAQSFHSGEGAFTKEPIQGYIYGPAASRVVVLEMTENGYVVPQTPWLNIAVSAWDSIDGADVLQSRDINITASIYAGKTERKALVLFLPATAPEKVDDLLSADRMSIKEAYTQYAVSAVQSACPDEYFTFDASAEERESVGLLFAKTTGLLADKNFEYAEGCAQWQYNISYVKDLASTKSPLYITYPYETISIYDAEGVEILGEQLSKNWLKYESLGDGLYGQVVMDMSVFALDNKPKPKAIDGYLVFKNEIGKVLSVLHCFYKEEEKSEVDVLEDASAAMFVDPSAAAAAGATISAVVSGPTYEKYKEQQAPIYIMTFTKDNTSLDIKTSKKCQLYTCVGKPNGPEMVTVDKQIYSDKEFADMIQEYLEAGRGAEIDWEADRSTMGFLKYGPTVQETRIYNGVSEINMTMPEPAEGEQKATTYEEVIQFATTESIQFIFICRLEL